MRCRPDPFPGRVTSEVPKTCFSCVLATWQGVHCIGGWKPHASCKMLGEVATGGDLWWRIVVLNPSEINGNLFPRDTF